MNIKYLRHNEIDKSKWDDLISRSPQSRIYAFTWYLDSVAINWDALVYEDYRAVFPLCWNNNYLGFKRIVQPLASQQLGLFTLQEKVPQEMVRDFILAIPNSFKHVVIQLNEDNPIPKLTGWIIKERINMILPLKDSYEELLSRFTRHTKNIGKPKKLGLIINNGNSIEKALELYFQFNKHKLGQLNSKEKTALKDVVIKCFHKGLAFVKIVVDENEVIHAVSLFLKSNDRIYNLLSASSKSGRNSNAMYFLLNEVIKEYANSKYILDFEGSMIPGIASFFSCFGVIKKPYYQIRLNRLPFLANLPMQLWYKLRYKQSF